MEVVRAANLCPAVLRLSRYHHTLCGSQSMILFRANCCNLYGHIARNNIIKLAVTKSVVKSGETEDSIKPYSGHSEQFSLIEVYRAANLSVLFPKPSKINCQ